MKTDNDILTELQALSPLLAGLHKENVFSVPDGYFDTLNDTILVCLHHEKTDIESAVKKDVPEGYFDNLSSSILDKIKTQQKDGKAAEEVVLSPVLKDIRKKNVFSVPEGYFNMLALEVMDKISLSQGNNSYDQDELPELLASIQHNNVFEVPAGYFDNFATAVKTRIDDTEIDAVMELETLSPLLLTVKHINVFKTPQGYFDSVQENIMKAALPAKAKVVRMTTSRSIFRYAAAAVITGAMALGVYKYVNTSVTSNAVPNPELAKISPVIKEGIAMNEQQFNDVLNSLTKDDITSYLEKNGSEEDVSMLTSSPDEIDLPNPDDYLLDDKTLENYLNKINFQN